jgi:pyruvate formate lyase activating enzyme
MGSLGETLERLSKEGELYERIEASRVRCFACAHHCSIAEGAAGVCKVRVNRNGTLYVPWGYTAGRQCDPVEKKPFFHVQPGAMAYSFGMLGCDFHCSYCQNWLTSQALRDPAAVAPVRPASPEAMVAEARRHGASVVVSTYNEPLITSEWATAVLREAKAANLTTGFVSNGHATPRVLDYLRPHLDLYKIDLKCFDAAAYRKLGGSLEPVLDTIRRVHEMGFWLEIVTLLVPGFNDSEDELQRLGDFIAAVSPDIPWHVSAFHGDYRMTDPSDTTPAMVLHALDLGRRAGLRFVYAGNLAGQVGPHENTYCHSCGTLLVERHAYLIRANHLLTDGRCPSCRILVPGRWHNPSRPRTAAPSA